MPIGYILKYIVKHTNLRDVYFLYVPFFFNLRDKTISREDKWKYYEIFFETFFYIPLTGFWRYSFRTKYAELFSSKGSFNFQKWHMCIRPHISKRIKLTPDTCDTSFIKSNKIKCTVNSMIYSWLWEGHFKKTSYKFRSFFLHHKRKKRTLVKTEQATKQKYISSRMMEEENRYRRRARIYFMCSSSKELAYASVESWTWPTAPANGLGYLVPTLLLQKPPRSVS